MGVYWDTVAACALGCSSVLEGRSIRGGGLRDAPGQGTLPPFLLALWSGRLGWISFFPAFYTLSITDPSPLQPIRPPLFSPTPLLIKGCCPVSEPGSLGARGTWLLLAVCCTGDEQGDRLEAGEHGEGM